MIDEAASPARARVLHAAAMAFALALGGLLGAGAVLVAVPGGAAAVAAMSGLPGPPAPEAALRLALACDTLIPLGYGAGIALLAAGFARAPSDWPVAAIAITFVAIGVTFDFVENGAAVTGRSMPVASVAKFGALGIAGLALAALIPGVTLLERVLRVVGQSVVPVFLALAVSGLAGPGAVWGFVPGLGGLLLLMAAVASQARRA